MIPNNLRQKGKVIIFLLKFELIILIIRQFRNENEKRRRDLFSKLITNLEDLLSIKQNSSLNDQTNKFDKASILRQTAQYLHKHRQCMKIFY